MKTFEKDLKNYRAELTALARAMIIRFKQEPILN